LHSSKNHKNIVVITSRFPYPLEKGDKLRAFYQIIELSKHFNIHLISMSEHDVKDEDRNQLLQYCASIDIYRIGKIEKWIGAALNLLIHQPIQVGYFFHHRINRKVKKRLQEIEPSHIYCQLIRAAEYVKNYHYCDKTIDYMDALSKGVERRSEKASGLSRIVFQNEFKRLLKYENAIFEYFENHTIISEQDRDYIFHKQRSKIKVIPNGVDESYLSYEKSGSQQNDLLFTGNMSYPPNITAANYIVNEVLPELNEEIRVTIAGANPVKEVQSMQCDRVNITGFVDDLKSYYASHKIFVAPMFLGTGLQNKLLEAMAIGLPCVTTTMANNALKAKPGAEILIADNSVEFAQQIDLLLADSDLRARIAKNGREFIKKNYNWETVTKELIELIVV
jgi:sugar transferase (PEP-CTERM/EpsH1 system associated)